jgi:hypothetical protein
MYLEGQNCPLLEKHCFGKLQPAFKKIELNRIR